jgi:hypothetical protein
VVVPVEAARPVAAAAPIAPPPLRRILPELPRIAPDAAALPADERSPNPPPVDPAGEADVPEARPRVERSIMVTLILPPDDGLHMISLPFDAQVRMALDHALRELSADMGYHAGVGDDEDEPPLENETLLCTCETFNGEQSTIYLWIRPN